MFVLSFVALVKAQESSLVPFFIDEGAGVLASSDIPNDDSGNGSFVESMDAEGKKTSYTYTLGGKLKTQTNAEGVTTTYSYNAMGLLSEVHFSDVAKTPSKFYTYDQLGRVESILVEGVARYEYIYNKNDQLVREDITFFEAEDSFKRSIERIYDDVGRPTGYQLKNGNVVEQNLVYSYDLAGRVGSIMVDGKTFSYDYVENAPSLLRRLSSPVHEVSHSYEERRDVLVSKINRWKNKADKSVISSYIYNVNNLGQRTSVTAEGEVFAETPLAWVWTYDALGQLVKANNCQYSYDSIGNRKIVQIEGELEMIYEANNLNQYSNIGNIVQSYDNEGNLLCGLTKTPSLPNRSGLNFVYNAENRPIEVKKEGQVQEEYAYDHFGRRIKKGNSFIIYDGFNAIAEYNISTKALASTNAWGLDLSGSTQGAGGVGGLLSTTDYTTQSPVTSYPTYDGNGNISEYLTEVDNGAISTHYEYDVFGNVIKKTGPREYAYQFSTKPFDKLTGLTYYNYRLYDPASGRWINRDPIQEKGGLNLYGFVGNNAIDKWDYLGNSDCDTENIECVRRCWNAKKHPYPGNVDMRARYAMCLAKCQAEYMRCEAEKALDTGVNAVCRCANKSVAWFDQNKEPLTGAVAVEGGLFAILVKRHPGVQFVMICMEAALPPQQTIDPNNPPII